MKNNHNNIGVIGAGFAGLSAASILAKHGLEVDVFEKNEQAGGRARQFETDQYVFDMGPSWYWMPDVFEKFYNQFGHTTSDFYDLKKLDPNFKMIFSGNDTWDIPSSWEALLELFENTEKGAAYKLVKFMEEAEYKYMKSMGKLIYTPSDSILEFAQLDIVKASLRLQLFSSFKKHVRKYFKDPRLVALMEFPILFLGAMPKDTPALYSMMNYSGLKQGTFYPMGGFGKVKEAMLSIAKEQGAKVHFDSSISKIYVQNNKVKNLIIGKGVVDVDAIIGAADYNHIESKLLGEDYSNYNEQYWDNKVFAPSCLLFYLGVNRKVDGLDHHNLFFDEDYELHAQEIYKDKKWPTKPLFYVCAPSKTDPTVAPVGHENLFLLVPVAPGIEDTRDLRAEYFTKIMERLEKYTGVPIREHIDYKKSYCIKDFENDYNAYKGNAYGLANTLRQTAIFKPKIKNKKIGNMFYAGQLTVPGPGVPPSIISGEIAANQLIKKLRY